MKPILLALALFSIVLPGALSADDAKPDWTIDAKTGKRLPADGGEPWKAYMAMQKAIETGKPAEVRKHMAKSVQAEMDAEKPEDAQKMIGMLKMMQPKDIRFVEGYASADKASLTVSGVSPMDPASKSKGSIKLVKEEGSWRVLDESWKS
jgi:hypothetical protein